MHLIKRVVLIGVSIILVFSAGCSAQATSQGGGLIISEVVTSNSNSLIDPVFGKPDWVELCNTSTSPINLLGYSISESGNSTFEFPDVTIAPGEYMILYCCPKIEGVTSGNLCTGFKLSKTGVTLILSSSNSTLQKLDVPALETDISYGVASDGKSYAYFGIPTPGAANTTESSPDLAGLESDKTVSLKINEVMPKASSNTESGWAEIINAGDKTVELSDYYISEDLSDTTKARLPEKQLGKGEYAVVKFTGNAGADEVPFKLGGSETTLAISNNFGAVIDNISWNASILPGMSAGRKDKSTVYFIEPTPGADNGAQYTEGVTFKEGTSDIRINEILLKNDYSLIDQDGDRSEWVELYNASQSTVSLLGYALSDREDDPLGWRLPNVELGAGQYLIVFLSGKDRAGDELHANFSLGSADSKLLLSNINTGTVQTVSLPAEKKSNVSYGLSSDGQWLFYYQPTPSAENNAQGFTDIAQIESQTPALRINEVASVSKAKSGDPDWVELHNQLSSDINLSGFFLSDDKDDLKKWPLGNSTIKAGGYKAIDRYKNGNETGELTISPSGENIYLSNAQGEVVDQFDTGVLRPGISRGLNSDNTVALFSKPTKGSANGSEVLQGYCAAPVFSAPGGNQAGPVTLTITTATKGAEIYYTTNGSMPTNSSKKYTGPLNIKKPSGAEGVTVKAIAVKSGMLSSDLMVATYLFDKAHTLPVICLSLSSADLKTVSNSPRKNKRERAGYVEYYEAGGKLGVSFPAGLRIAGAGTLHYKQRTFNLYLRGAYGQSSVTYPFFDNYDITTFKSLTLRNMGGWQDPSRLRDVFLSQMANGMNIDNAQSKFTAVYINGKYWGLYEFKENVNQDYFASKYGIDPDKVVMVRGNKWNVDTKNGYKVVPDMVRLLSFAKRNINGSSDWKKYTDLTDSDYIMDYLIAETFFFCNDSYNQKFVHTTDGSLKWRPVYYDFDLSFRSAKGNFFKLMTQQKIYRPSGQFTDVSLYNAYYRNPAWRKAFVKRYAYVLNNILTTDKLLTTYNILVDSIKDEMPRTVKRWKTPSSLSKWNSNVSSMRSIIKNRRNSIIKQLKNLFDLSNAEIKELFPNG